MFASQLNFGHFYCKFHNRNRGNSRVWVNAALNPLVFDINFSFYFSFSVKERQDLHTPSRQTNEQPLTTSEHTFEFAYTDFHFDCHLKVNILSFLTFLMITDCFWRKRRHDNHVSKIAWKPFKFNLIFTQIKLFRWSLSLSFASPTLSILSTTNFSVYSPEDLAVIAALNYSGVWKQIKIKMLFTAAQVGPCIYIISIIGYVW